MPAPPRALAIWRIAAPLVTLAVGILIGGALGELRAASGRARALRETREGGYRFINPLLECQLGEELFQSPELRPFRDRLQALVRDPGRFPGLDTVAIYFRELNDGIWFSIGDIERFTPASLRKVPTMMALLKQAEREPGLLDRKVRVALARDYTEEQTFKPSQRLEPGREYAVGELIRRMIAYSDNNAFMVLSGIVDREELGRIYGQLDLRSPGHELPGEYHPVQTYASFFRILYNANYLGKGLSDLALSFLAQSDLRIGIVNGVPPEVPVAHKFGEKRDDAADLAQLHDCGIVYFPERPYLLCVMTRGHRFEELDGAIAGISRIVYDEVRAQHHEER